jgi:hypothetical protein
MLDPYKIQVVQMLTASSKQWRHDFGQNFIQFMQQYPATLDCLRFSDEAHFYLVCEQAEHEVFGRPLKIQTVMETSCHPAKCIMQCAVSKQGLIRLISLEGTIIEQWYLQHLQNEVFPGAGHVDISFFHP